MKTPCAHSCRNLCNALAVAERREREAIEEYRRFLAACDYPDVREVLATLIGRREQSLALLAEKRESLQVKFGILDDVAASFEQP